MDRFQTLFALLVALAVSVGPSGIARPCYCAGPTNTTQEAVGGCCSETLANSCGAGSVACCCTHSSADASREIAAGCRGEWIPGCCCTQSAPSQAPGERSPSVEREASVPLFLPAAELPFVAARSATALPRPPGDLSPPRPAFSILYCVWRE